MRKQGFTIVGVLLTLGVIGIIAALTIPSLSSDYQKKVIGAALATAVSNFENAITTMIADECVKDLFATEAWRAIKEEGELKSSSTIDVINALFHSFN